MLLTRDTMSTKNNKRKNYVAKGTSNSVAMEDTLMPNQQQQFANTGCLWKKDKSTFQWGDIYRTIKE